MAITSSINLDKVSGSVKSLNTGIGQLKKSADTIKTVSLNKIKVKRESIVRDKILSNMREEQVKRRDQESVIEASGIGGAFKRVTSVIGDSTKGFLDRIINFASSILIGWLLYNLPTIITGIEDLITRIKSLYGILTGFVSNITNTFQNFGTLLSAVYQDITHFDFTDQSKRVQNAMDDLNVNLDLMRDQFMEGFDLLKTPLGEGPGEEPIPALNTDYTQPAPTTGIEGGGGGGGRWKPLLDLIASGEGGYTSIAPGDSNPNLTKMTIAEANRSVGIRGGRGAIGRYQFTTPIQQAKRAGLNPNKDLFSPQNQDKMAVNLIIERGGDKWLSGKMTDERFSEELSNEWGSFRSASGNVLPNNSGAIGFDKLKPVLKKIKALPAQTSQAQTSQAQSPSTPSRGVTTTVRDEFKGKPGGAAGVITSERGMRTNPVTGRYKMHEGIDIAPAGPGYYVALKVSGTVDYIGWDPRGYGHFVDIKSGNTIYRFGHLAKVMVKGGQPYNGQTIGEIGRTGGVTGIHLHFEVRPGGKDSINPRPYLGLLSIGKKLTGSPGQQTQISTPTPSTPKLPPAQLSPRVFQVQTPETQSAQLSSMTTPGQNVPAITQDRKGRQTVVIEDRQQSAPQQVFVGGGSQIQMMPIEDSLNSMIKNQILLELAYT